MLIAGTIFVANRAAIVGRAVINENQFKIRKRLRQNRIDARAQVFFNLVNGNDNGNFWRGILIHIF